MPVRAAIWQAVETSYKRYNLRVDDFIDWKYGIKTSLIEQYDQAQSEQTKFQDPSANRPTSVSYLLELRRVLSPSMNDIFMDLGCGTGRAVFVFARSDVRLAKGVDFGDLAYECCMDNLHRYRYDKTKIEFRKVDVCSVQFGDETIFFLANPFGIKTLNVVMSNLQANLKANPRPIRLCYFNPLHSQFLDGLPWLRRKCELKSFKNCILIYENILDLQ